MMLQNAKGPDAACSLTQHHKGGEITPLTSAVGCKRSERVQLVPRAEESVPFSFPFPFPFCSSFSQLHLHWGWRPAKASYLSANDDSSTDECRPSSRHMPGDYRLVGPKRRSETDPVQQGLAPQMGALAAFHPRLPTKTDVLRLLPRTRMGS